MIPTCWSQQKSKIRPHLNATRTRTHRIPPSIPSRKPPKNLSPQVTLPAGSANLRFNRYPIQKSSASAHALDKHAYSAHHIAPGLSHRRAGCYSRYMPDPVITSPDSMPAATGATTPNASAAVPTAPLPSTSVSEPHEHSRRQLEALLEVSEAISQQRDLTVLFH